MTWGAVLIAIFLAIGLARPRGGRQAAMVAVVCTVVVLAYVFRTLGR
jgi:hypothetical protein